MYKEKENYRDLGIFQIKKEMPSNIRWLHRFLFGLVIGFLLVLQFGLCVLYQYWCS